MNKIKTIVLITIATNIFISGRAQQGNHQPFKEIYRPQYHLTPIQGALFDPTALVYVNGQYQVNRKLATSTDLIHWKHGSVQRINTDSTLEMSGSVVIDENNTSGFGKNGKAPLVAVYSGLRSRDGRQFQCIAYSNDEGKTWTAYDKNPVIDIESNEFRDPQVFWHQQTKKWVMVVAMAAEQKVRFYNSDNLKEWNYLSDFGPAGAVKGVWECPDLFALPVDGNKQNMKWVLEVDVQPIGGQYFVGEFDGQKFTTDPDFLAWLDQLKKNQVPLAGEVLFDFENDLSGWKTEGVAFSASPANGALPYQNAVIGYEGKKLVNSFHNRDDTKGKVTSPSFRITKKYLNFLIGGGDHPGETCMNLIVNNKVVRTKTGIDTEVLYWANWDVSEFLGQAAALEIVDNHSGGFGHISIDHVMLSDTQAKSAPEETSWIDYGPDFYAVRSWVNGPDERRVWVAWLGSWLYAHSVPTTPWKGGHSFPREVKLKTFPEGVRMIQQPVNEIQKLRDQHSHFESIEVNEKTSFTGLKVTDNVYELEAKFEVDKEDRFGIDLCKMGDQKTRLIYDAKEERLVLDRSQSGETSFSVSFPHAYSAPLKLRNNSIKLRILVDRSSIEVFGNNGEATITCQIFPDPKSNGIEVFSEKGNVRINRLDTWALRSIWKN
jgi:sucrose-6-phosphate hydrolase SacC (GH32 family)